MPSQRAWVTLALALQLALSVGLLVVAILSVNGNYLVDRDTGAAVPSADKTLFSVSKGESFVNLSSAIVFLVHATWALYAVNRGDRIASDVLSALLVSGFLVTLMALQLGALWGSVSTTLDYLECGEVARLPTAANDIKLKCGGFQSVATALCVLSSLVFCAQGSCTSMLYTWEDHFLGRAPAGSAGGAAGGTGTAYESMVGRTAEEAEPFPTDPLPGVFVNLSATAAAATPRV